MEKAVQKQLNLSDKDVQEWQATSPEDSLAVWACKNSKVHMDKYMEWACENYQIPFLKDDFFYNANINSTFWNNVKNQAKWNEKFLPLYSWENLVFAGCLEPPKEAMNKNIVPVLVSPEKMEFCWNKIKSFDQIKPPLYNSKKNKNNLRVVSKDTSAISQLKTNIASKSINLFNTIASKTIMTEITSSSSQEVYDQIYQISARYFSGVIIFLFKEKEFKPIEWSPSMEGPATPISISEPSMFRMIVSTRTAYHGFIVDNQVHRNFFKPWGFASLPRHVTLIPLINKKKKIVGAFMGLADKTIHQKHLQKVKTWASHIAECVENSKEQYEEAA